MEVKYETGRQTNNQDNNNDNQNLIPTYPGPDFAD